MAALDEFARQLMRVVRDRAIVACDAMVSGSVSGPQGENWRRQEEGARSALQALLPDVVDQVLFELLAAIDGGELRIGWRDPAGTLHDLEELGRSEMAGWLMMGAGDWRDRYSSQRFNDYNAWLGLDFDWNPDAEN